MIERALISVSDKHNAVFLARHLQERGVEILSTGGTARTLSENGVEVIEVSDYTEFPEIMGGRLKTLHPRVHGGLLGRLDVDVDVMREHDIKRIDLLVVNLYPFGQTIAKPDCDLATAIENIDIGGPAMLRAAAKNYVRVGAVVDVGDYPRIIDEMDANGNELTYAFRFKLAGKVFEHTSHYDRAVADYIASVR